MAYQIYFPTPLCEIADVENDNIDVCVQTEKEHYTFTVATLKNLSEPCWMNGDGFVEPCAPFLVVEKLTEEVIAKLIGSLMQDKKLAALYGKDVL